MKTLPPAGSTSPTLATRYWMRPSRGADERIVEDVDPVEFDIVALRRRARARASPTRCVAADLGRGCAALICCRRWSSSSTVAKPFGTRALVRSSSCLCKRNLGLLLREVGLGLVERVLRLATSAWDFFSEAWISRVSIIATTWPALTMSPSSTNKLGDAAGELGVDVDLVGFETAIAPGKARRQPCLGVPPPTNLAASQGEQQEGQSRQPPPAPSGRPRWQIAVERPPANGSAHSLVAGRSDRHRDPQ